MPHLAAISPFLFCLRPKPPRGHPPPPLFLCQPSTSVLLFWSRGPGYPLAPSALLLRDPPTSLHLPGPPGARAPILPPGPAPPPEPPQPQPQPGQSPQWGYRVGKITNGGAGGGGRGNWEGWGWGAAGQNPGGPEAGTAAGLTWW